MVLSARVWTAGKLLVLAGALVATYLLFAVASMRLALRAREVRVPDLLEQTASEATALASARGLAVRVEESRRADPEVPVDHVVSQEPAPGTPLRRQRTVRVWWSAGLRAAAIPALAGEPERSAQTRLAQDGLDLAGVSEIRSQDYASDVVIAQDPAPKTAGEQVTLLVNRGEYGASYVMPDLIGVNGDRATLVLRSQGFRVAVVASAPYPGVPSGVVLRQSPQAGFQTAPGEPISIEVSQ
jgi:beta-lactam-binding protein with PASTA domain